MARVDRLKRDVMQVEFLFPFERNTNLEEIINLLKKYILALIYDQEYLDTRDSFCEMCREFYESDFKRMATELAISQGAFAYALGKIKQWWCARWKK